MTVADQELTSENVVDGLLSRPYLELDPVQQDAVFREAASSIFEAATGDLADPVAFVQGLGRAADEGRFLVASFDEDEDQALVGTRVRGALSGDDGATPHVDIGLNDGTGSKMSYYLRYNAEVRARSCSTGKAQSLDGTMSLSQSIPPDEAAQLPDSVTGGGLYEIKPGNQLVFVRIYGPYGGHPRRDPDGRQGDPGDAGRPRRTPRGHARGRAVVHRRRRDQLVDGHRRGPDRRHRARHDPQRRPRQQRRHGQQCLLSGAVPTLQL